MNNSVLDRVQEITDRKSPHDALVDIGGPYVYSCRITGKSDRFQNGDMGRSGWMFLFPNAAPEPDAVEVELYGLRLCATQNGKESVVLPEPKKWLGRGSLSVHGVDLQFQYQLGGGELGMSRDSFRLPPQGIDAIWPGHFEHVRTDGIKVSG